MTNKLTAEQMGKLKTCKTAEEAKALAEKENIELTDDALNEVAGGKAGYNDDTFQPLYDPEQKKNYGPFKPGRPMSR